MRRKWSRNGARVYLHASIKTRNRDIPLLHADRDWNRKPGYWGLDGRIPFTDLCWLLIASPHVMTRREFVASLDSQNELA